MPSIRSSRSRRAIEGFIAAATSAVGVTLKRRPIASRVRWASSSTSLFDWASYSEVAIGVPNVTNARDR